MGRALRQPPHPPPPSLHQECACTALLMAVFFSLSFTFTIQTLFCIRPDIIIAGGGGYGSGRIASQDRCCVGKHTASSSNTLRRRSHRSYCQVENFVRSRRLGGIQPAGDRVNVYVFRPALLDRICCH